MTHSFQQQMVDNLGKYVTLQGKAVLELGSDIDLECAERFVSKGAASVIASNMFPKWAQKSNPNVVLMRLDARHIADTIERHSVDIVFAINFLEHISDIDSLMRGIVAVLKPGGVCFLHGHPIWTSSRGNHFMFDRGGKAIVFGDDLNPIPPWAHLYWSEVEMREELQKRNIAEDMIEAAVYWSFRTSEINRIPFRQMKRSLSAYSLKTMHLHLTEADAPGDEIVAALKKGKWWDPEENYRVRQLTYNAEKV